MKAAFVINARDKERWVGHAVESALKQTLTPLEIVLSDQGSTDRTFAVMADLASRYDGPNKVSLMRCRDTAFRGMAGLNAHIDCTMKNVDADVFIFNSADDWSHPERSAKVLRAFEETGADYVGTGVQYTTESNEVKGYTGFPKESRFVTCKEIIEHLVGGSASCAWTREFYERVGPTPGAVGPDTYLPPLAALGKGYYYLNEVLHAYFVHPDEANTGLGGVREGQKDDDGKLRVSELELWQLTAGFLEIMDATNRMGLKVDDESAGAIMEGFYSRAMNWTRRRHELGLKRLQPMALPI